MQLTSTSWLHVVSNIFKLNIWIYWADPLDPGAWTLVPVGSELSGWDHWLMMLASHKSYFGVKTRGTHLDVGIYHPYLFPRHLCGCLHCFIMSHFWFLEMRWKGVRAACCEASMDPRASFDAEASRGLCWARARAPVSYSQCLIGISSMAIYIYIRLI